MDSSLVSQQTSLCTASFKNRLVFWRRGRFSCRRSMPLLKEAGCWLHELLVRFLRSFGLSAWHLKNLCSHGEQRLCRILQLRAPCQEFWRSEAARTFSACHLFPRFY